MSRQSFEPSAPGRNNPGVVLRSAHENDPRPLIYMDLAGVPFHANAPGSAHLEDAALRNLLRVAANAIADGSDTQGWSGTLLGGHRDGHDGRPRSSRAVEVSKLSARRAEIPVLLCVLGKPRDLVAGIDGEARAATFHGDERRGRRHIDRVVDAAPVMIWAADLEGARTWASGSLLAYTGRSLAQDRGSGWIGAVHVEDRDRCVGVYQSCMSSRVAFSLDYRLRHRDGHYRWVMDSGAPRQENGECIGFVGGCVDVHERRLMEDALAERARQLRLRSSGRLAGPRGAGDALGAVAPVEPAAPAPVVVSEAVEGLRALMQQHEGRFTGPGEADADTEADGGPERVALRLETLSIGGLVERGRLALEATLEAGGHRLTIDMPEPRTLLLCDPTRIVPALCHVVESACRFRDGGARVVITVRHHDSAVFLRVRESDSSVPPDFVPKAFELFVKHRRVARGDRAELAAGLASARGIFRRHGGEIMVFGGDAESAVEFVLQLPRTGTANTAVDDADSATRARPRPGP